MTAPNIKLWRREKTAIVSPPYPDIHSYDRVKKFFIRAGINIESDDARKLIRIITDEEKAPENMKKLERLGLI